jgi:DNA modification methylase
VIENTAYTLEPIRRAFPAKKFEAWHYKIHPYYTKQPSNVVGEYIRHFCPEGGLVVDPFCGSGVTAIEALTNKRRTICLDLDPLAVFITRQTCLPADLNAFWDAYHQIEKKMKPVVDFVRKASFKELEDYDLKEWYPKDVKIPGYVDQCNAGLVENLFGRGQLISLAHLHAAILKINEQKTRDLLLFVFSGTLDKVSIMYRAPEQGKKHGGGSALFMVYRYWVPKQPAYPDVWNVFEASVKRVAKSKDEGNTVLSGFVDEGKSFAVYNDAADNLLKYVGKGTVDYIYTDPPYGAHIAYLDLSTMWHAWLGLSVTDEMRAKEAIEAGNQQFDEKHYLDMLQKSFEQMFYALKDEAWLSLVFHHKKTNLWYSIRDMMRYIGFTYVNTVAQPLSQKTFAKIKNPLRVLGESLIVNFQKSAARKIFEPIPLPLANVIKNAAERAIAAGGGATTEEIMREVVPELFEAGLMVDAASKSMGDILAMLEQEYEQGEDNLWHLKTGHKLGNFIGPRVRIRYYVISYLRRAGKANFDNIVTTVLPLLMNGHQPSKEDIADVLKEIAISYDGINWELKDPNATGVQGSLPLFSSEKSEEEYTTEMPASTTHNQQIYRLALLCRRLGYVPYIGKQERNDPMFGRLKPLTSLNIKAEPVQYKRIEQIDIIWATDEGVPVWAFEIEEHTTILSALERFVALLSVAPELGKNRQLTIVVPKSRRKKTQQELTGSSYIGHPQYIDNKICYMFYDDLEAAFKRYSSKRDVNLNDIHKICQLPASLED